MALAILIHTCMYSLQLLTFDARCTARSYPIYQLTRPRRTICTRVTTQARRPYRTLRCFREKRRKCSWRVHARHFHYSSRRQIQHTRKVVVVIASSLSRHRSLTQNECVRTLVSARNFSRRYSRTNPFINWLFVRRRADWVSYAVVQDPMQCGGGVRWRP